MVDAGVSFTCIPIAAGPFHNLLLWAFFVLVTRLGLFSLASFVSGYRDISDVGQVVIGVEAGSPLYLHLSPQHIERKSKPLNRLKSLRNGRPIDDIRYFPISA